ncbi:hypothetical protein ATI02_0905 [Pseudomonas baetica]|uniref:5-deoxy-glucuronate isomerase n=1 Tax=Pseudomonas baetica TaxID=674054 RepID=A0ABX4PVT2_9PSED|nr:hypothetical protein [Pseudomonas baetica]PKA68160.1 hypothetical protein ATI02_0905 [Pseudomonas baetica]PTC17967.1 hypothetical protein C0J26_18145 [Pseudomonas baetica]
MYDKADPRSSLYTSAAAQRYAAAQYARFYEKTPTEERDGEYRAWYARGQNFICVYLEGQAGAVFSRLGQVDEFCVLIPDAATALEIQATGKAAVAVAGESIAFVPPGDSSIRVTQSGRLVLIFTTRSADLCAKCINADSYVDARENIPPFQPWPEPVGGYQLRHYRLNVAPAPGRFGRIWRCSTLMINFLEAQVGPRDVTKLSPHHHDDFEQGSFALDGAFVHHIRWPWTPNLHDWLADDHEHCGSPSIAVIPPPAIHTSMGVAPGLNQLIDIFSPPRMDFSLQDGWVLNADDYPLPA